jgi:FemAB family protein
MFCDLQPDLQDIRSSFRKSFKPLINVGLRTWASSVHSTKENLQTLWEEFQNFHLQVSGRITRCEKSWVLQRNMVASENSFLICIRNPITRRLVGAGFFQTTRDEGLYSVGVYDRDLFDKPLGHVVQQLAIEFMKQQGLIWYRLGERHLPQDVPQPSTKEVSISNFKEGFASHLWQRYDLTLSLRQ